MLDTMQVAIKTENNGNYNTEITNRKQYPQHWEGNYFSCDICRTFLTRQCAKEVKITLTLQF